MDASTHVSRVQMESGDFKPLYDSGVRYRVELWRGAYPGVERFQTVDSQRDVGYDDCDGLAPVRAAELQREGHRARARAVKSSSGWHVVVERWTPDGYRYIEDPSARLGMLDDPRAEGSDTVAIHPDEVAMIARRTDHVNGTRVVVGALAGDVILTSRGIAYADEVVGADFADSSRRRRALAAMRAFGGLTRQATSLATAPARAARSTLESAAAIATRARRAQADVETMTDLGVDDEANEDAVEGWDRAAWEAYRGR